MPDQIYVDLIPHRAYAACRPRIPPPPKLPAHLRKKASLEKLFKKTEFVANIAIIIVAVLLLGVVAKRFFNSPSQQTAAARPVESQHNLGKIALPGVNWSNSPVLVLAISTSCHFCTESAPFYRNLTKSHPGVRLVAVFPQPVEAGQQYLQGLGVATDQVLQAQLDSINVSGTPTLLLVNKDGSVLRRWVGLLPKEGEADVWDALKSIAS